MDSPLQDWRAYGGLLSVEPREVGKVGREVLGSLGIVIVLLE